jgi:hypothetical protein
MSRFVIVLLLSLAVCGPALGALSPAVPNGPLRLAQPLTATRPAEQVYLVQLAAPPVVAYEGGITGLAATKPQLGRKLSPANLSVSAYAQRLAGDQDAVLASAGALNTKVHSYQYAFNGFAARLSAAQLNRLRRSDQVIKVWDDSLRRLSTSNSAVFLGLLNNQEGLRTARGLKGEDVVIGFVDSGVATGHPALQDFQTKTPRLCESDWATTSLLGLWLCRRFRTNPERIQVFDPVVNFAGTCETGEGFPAGSCNNKLVGARYFADGFMARNEMDPGEFLSPQDADGHGTHIATIAAGNPVTARLFGARLASVSGIAPRARVAVYKACFLLPGDTRASCTLSDLVQAIDAAVADGVDVLNYAVGSAELDPTAPDAIALLNAAEAGIFASVAAGNGGPNDGSIESPGGAPWVITVAASSQSGQRFVEALRVTESSALNGLYAQVEASFTPTLAARGPIEAELVLVDDVSDVLADGGAGTFRDACEELTAGNDLSGRIALIARGGCPFQDKLSRVELAGAVGAVVYNNAGDPIQMVGDPGSVDIPAVMISTSDGQLLVDELVGGGLIRVELAKDNFLQRSEAGNVVSDFSARGPNLTEPSFIKPDVSAPGQSILAGQTPTVANGIKGEQFQYLSGTSQSSAQVAGIAALLREARPDWTVDTIKSALTTSAYTGLVNSDGGAAGPFDVGAGHVRPNAALEPGLVYPAESLDYAAYLCGLENSPIAAVDCAVLASTGVPFNAEALNLPSIGSSRLISGDTIVRRVTNLGDAATYTATVTEPLGFQVTVTPPSLTLATGETGTYQVTIDRQGAPLDQWAFGRLVWSDGATDVASPIAVNAVALDAPAAVSGRGRSGQLQFPVRFGYSGAYLAGVHGLRAPLRLAGSVDDDPGNTFSFRFDDGVALQLISIPPDQAYARFALFDEFTDGDDDLDLYLFYCPNNECTQVAESGSFTSAEEINLVLPVPGVYAALIHGFETDQISGGPGANYELFAWSFGIDDNVGNLAVTAPDNVTAGDAVNLDLTWGQLEPDTRYLGAISHTTPAGLEALTILTIDAP